MICHKPCQTCGRSTEEWLNSVFANHKDHFVTTMESNQVVLVICLTLFIVIGVNAAIYVSFRNRSTVNQIELFRHAIQRARHPWKDEDEALQELSILVASLKDTEKNQDSETTNREKREDDK